MSLTRRAFGLRAYLNLALAVTIAVFALAGAFTYTEVEVRIRADVEERLDTLSRHFAGDTLAIWLRQKRNLARSLAAYPAIREMRVREAQRIIDATYAAAPADYNNIGLFDSAGLMVADIAGGTGKVNLIGAFPWGQEVYDGRRTRSPETLSNVNKRPIFVLYERVLDNSGAVVGVVGVGTNLTVVGDRLQELETGQTGEAVLVNSQGLALNRLRHKPDSVLSLDLAGDPLTRLALGGRTGIIEMSDYRGVAVVAAYRAMPEYGWGIVVKQDAAEAFAVLARLRAVFFGVIAGALAVALALNLFVQRRVSLALGRLIAGSQRLAAGESVTEESATPIEPLPIREFGRLADAFNRMAATLAAKEARLRSHAGQLEQRVRERTAQLEAANQELAGEIAERKRAEAAMEEAELRYRTLFEQSPHGVLIVDPATAQAVEFNEAAHRQLGYTREEFATLRVSDYEAAEKPEQTAARIEKILREGRDDFETLHHTKAGETRNVLVAVQTIKISGRPHFHTVFRDITEHRRTEAELRQSEAKFRTIIEASPVPYALNDDLQNITYLNAAFVSTFGYDREDIPTLAAWWPKAYPDAEYRQWVAAAWQARLDHAKRTGAPFEAIELNIRCKDGLFRTALVGIAPLGEALEGTHVAILYDITGRKRAEAAIQKLNADLESRVADLDAANNELEAFTYSVSHDLRAPLRHVAGFANLLQARAAAGLDEKSLHYLTTIAASTKRMGTLIDDLLAFSRVGRTTMQRGAVSLEQTVKEALRELRQDTEGRNIEWKIGPLPEAHGDSALLRMVWVNLIANAVKYTRTRPRAEIEIGCDASRGRETVFFVRDNGVGFDMKYVDKLFGVFQRLHSAREFEGTGIGLANVRRIVHRHGGRTWAEGAVEGGATFHFSLPNSAAEALP